MRLVFRVAPSIGCANRHRHRCRSRAVRCGRSANQRKRLCAQVLNSERFADLAPRQVYGTLLDEGEYYCSVSSMYRILGEHDEVNERRQQRAHPTYTRPELLATAPNQVWSWDITWLRGPGKWQHFYLYVILDVFSRYVVGWLLAEEEAGLPGGTVDC